MSLLAEAGEFKYRGVVLMGVMKMERESNGQLGACLSSCGLVPDHCGEAGSELHGKAFDLAFNPASNSHLPSCGSGSDWEGQGQAHKNSRMRFPRLATGRRLRDGVRTFAGMLMSFSGLDHRKLAP